MNDSEKLKTFIRFEMDPDLFNVDYDGDEYVEYDQFEGSYKPTCRDLITACENMINTGVDITTTKMNMCSETGMYVSLR